MSLAFSQLLLIVTRGERTGKVFRNSGILRKTLKGGNIVSLLFPIADCGFGEELNPGEDV